MTVALVGNKRLERRDLGSIDYKVETFYTQYELDKRLFDSFFFN